MRNLGQLLFVLSIIAAAVGTWVNLSWKSIEELTNTPSESRIDYYLSDFTLTKTQDDGSVAYKLTGRHLTHKQASGASEIFQPNIRARSDNGDDLFVDAEKALQVGKDDTIKLTGKIRVHKPASGESPEFTLTTEDLIYNPQQRHITTESEISLISPAGTLTGTGLDSNLEEQELRILSNVQAEFQAP